MTRHQTQPEPVLGRFLLMILLLVYGAAMIAMPILLFGLPTGLWISAALLAGGIGVMVVLTGVNSQQETPAPAAPQPCIIKVTPPAPEGPQPRTLPLS